jgi:molybdate transport system regulatory protein
MEEIILKGRLWLQGPHGTLLGKGRVALLKRIHEYGSINQAAKSLNMSYRQAWRIVDIMNSQLSSPLVTKISGGPQGGGSQITAMGHKLIHFYENLQNEFQTFLADKEEQLKMLGEPPR